jgi:hypothetical protein
VEVRESFRFIVGISAIAGIICAINTKTIVGVLTGTIAGAFIGLILASLFSVT